MTAKQLTDSILQMAIQGKLVPQDPNDEPASVLLERIREKKRRLVTEGKLKKKELDVQPITEDEIPFDIPEGWEWVRLCELLEIISDGTHKTPQYVPVGVPFLSVQNISSGKLTLDRIKYISEEEHKILIKRIKPQKGDILLCRIGTLGKALKVTWDFDFSIFVSLGLLRPLIDVITNYVVFCINSPLGTKWILDKRVGGGTHTYKINLEDIPNFILPLPPIDEQYRIVEKIEEYRPIIKEYGEAYDEASKMDAELPDKLKKSILQEAIKGHLVSQDSKEESAKELLVHIRNEKEILVSDGTIKKKDISVIPIEEENYPYTIPETWEWVRLQDITTYISRGKSPVYSETKKYPIVAQKCNQWSGFSLEKAKFADPKTIEKYAEERLLQDGDLLWNSTGIGTLGRMAIYDSSVNEYGWAAADSHVTVIRTRPDFAYYKYLYYYFASPEVQSVIEDKSDGSTKQKELAQDTVKMYEVPLPPLAEQHRIVKKIEELYAEIDNMTVENNININEIEVTDNE